MTAVHAVDVDVTPVWRSPDAPRPVESAVTADEPDHAAWLAAMDDAGEGEGGRSGLDDRIDTEALRGEPVIVHEERDGWSRVTLPWQPSRANSRGYPGWVRSRHLAPGGPVDWPTASIAISRDSAIDQARSHLGVAYLWGGISDAGLDCSGLVHSVFRRMGIIVPRDAHDQAAAALDVPLGSETTGDLYFFAEPGESIHHVGFVVEPGLMLHAPQTGARIVEEPLDLERRGTLVSAGRFRIA